MLGLVFPVSIPTVSGRSKIVVDQTLCMNSPIDGLVPGEGHSSFKYSVEDKSLVIDKFKSERTLYIGNFPDGHIQKRQREM